MKIRRAIPEIQLGWDSYDAFGSTMAWWFGCAVVLDSAAEDIPSHWEYCGRTVQGSHLDLCEDEEFEGATLGRAIADGLITWDDVRHFGNVLCRYRETLARQGRDY